ncbi:BF3164 family lipoprotein [uncultured Bacteroides sp.]|uniref:BF3164 family lipoprotein n=1 Tax=uncultured Bacteroides sp. TaxID=162156 RepID=UPI0025E52E63|nr:BF3164 family lipoprotein [uncultured Bacteroides sp.]
MPLRIAYIISLAYIFLFISCTSKSVVSGKEYYTDFSQEQELKAKTILLDTALFRYPFRLHSGDGKVVVLDLHGTDYFFHAFSYPDFHYLSSFGKRGDAPQDMLSAENFRWNGAFLWTLDANKSELTRFEFALSGDSLLRKEAVNLDKDILRALDFVMCEDSTFIIPDYSGDSRFCRVDRNGRLLHKFGTIPSANEDALQNVRPALAQAWRSFIDYNPQNGVLAAVTQLGEVLEIYNFKDSTHVVCAGPHGEPEFQVSEGYGIPIGIMGFSDVQVTDKAIYAVFQGRSFKEIARSAQNGVSHLDGGQYIYVFSLTGEPLKKYVLDHYICGISVDEQRGVIYTTDVNKDEPILEFDIS